MADADMSNLTATPTKDAKPEEIHVCITDKMD
jgi:hypothetical protein